MRKLFLSNLTLLLSVNILIKIFWVFGIDRTVQNTLGASGYGLYFAIYNFAFMASLLLDPGFNNLNNRIISQNNTALGKYVSYGLTLKFLFSIVYIAVTFVVAALIGYNKEHFRLLCYLVVLLIIFNIVQYARSNLSALLMFKTDSLISVLDKIFAIAICSILIWGGVTTQVFKIEWYISAQIFGYAVTAVIVLAILFKKAGRITLKWNKHFTIVMIKKALPYALLAVLISLYCRIESVLLERLLPASIGSEQAGIYASAFRLIDSANLVPTMFAVLLLPIFAKMIHHKEDFKPILKLAFTLLFVFSIIFVFASYFFAENIMSLLYTNHIAESTAVFKRLVFTFIPWSITWIIGTLLTANGSLKQLNIIAVIAVVINITLNLILIPKFEAIGSVYANIVGQCINAGLQIFVFLKIFKIKINPKFLLQLITFIVITILLGLTCKHYISNPWIAILTMCITITLIISLMNFNSVKRIIIKNGTLFKTTKEE